MLLAHAGGDHALTYLAGPILTLALAAAFYARGLSRLPAQARGPWIPRTLAFYSGLLILGVALTSPLESAAERALSLHMVQHVLLLLAAPPLLVLGRPVTMAAIALPARWSQAFRYLRTRRSGEIRAQLRPVPAWLLSTPLLWAWHLPTLYQTAVAQPVVHLAEHATFLAAGVTVWGVALGSLRRHRRSYGSAVLVLLSTSLAGAALGALLTFAPQSIYPIYDGQAYLGLTALEHQQLAGVIMWVPGSIVYALTTAWIGLTWFRHLDGQAEKAGGAPLLPGRAQL